METLLLFQKFSNDAEKLVDEAIKRFKYWKEKFIAREMKPTMEDIEREYSTALKM